MNVKENLCENCLHCEVCIHKKDFSTVQNVIDNLFINIEERHIRLRNIPSVKAVTLSCNFYRKNVVQRGDDFDIRPP